MYNGGHVKVKDVSEGQIVIELVQIRSVLGPIEIDGRWRNVARKIMAEQGIKDCVLSAVHAGPCHGSRYGGVVQEYQLSLRRVHG
jgi:hypothetical protein